MNIIIEHNGKRYRACLGDCESRCSFAKEDGKGNVCSNGCRLPKWFKKFEGKVFEGVVFLKEVK